MPEQLLYDVISLSQISKPTIPITKPQYKKHASIILLAFDRTITDLIIKNISIKVVFLSFFYAWIRLEAAICQASEPRIPVTEASIKVINLIKEIISTLPDYPSTKKRKKMSDTLNSLKLQLSDEIFNPLLSQCELAIEANTADTAINAIICRFLKQSVPLEIIANAIFCKWLRLSTLHASVSEDYYLKINYNINKIIISVRKFLPELLSW